MGQVGVRTAQPRIVPVAHQSRAVAGTVKADVRRRPGSVVQALQAAAPQPERWPDQSAGAAMPGRCTGQSAMRAPRRRARYGVRSPCRRQPGRPRPPRVVRRGGPAPCVRLVLRGPGLTGPRVPGAGLYARGPVLRARLPAFGAPVHVGRADWPSQQRRATRHERAVYVRGRPVRTGLDAEARGRAARAKVSLSDRADRLLRATVSDRSCPPDAHLPGVGRPHRPVLLLDESAPANGEDRPSTVSVA